MSYDGTLLDETTGLATAKHPFSAASKEVRKLSHNAKEMCYPRSIAYGPQSLQIMLYTHAMAGSAYAARFLSPDNSSNAPTIAYDIMALKLQTYLKFNASYPGFGGYLPWYTGDQIDILPMWDWVNRVPALDNGYIDKYSPPPI
jgi:hypothetical protein